MPRPLSFQLFLGTLCMLPAFSAEGPIKAAMPEQHAKVFKTYCYDCHDAFSEEGNLNLEDIPFNMGKDIPTASLWQKILDAVNSGEMPPHDEKQISAEHKTAFLEDLSVQIVNARKILTDNGGVITMRRLNQREYSNTIESLLGVTPNVSNLPADEADHGFDTAGASLFFSPDQLEQYLASAKDSLELAFAGIRKIVPHRQRVEPEIEANERHSKTLADYQDRLFRVKAYQSQKKKPPSAFGFLDTHQIRKTRVNARNWSIQLEDYFKRPETKTGATSIQTIKGGGMQRIRFNPLSHRGEGKYIIRIRIGAYPEASERLKYIEISRNRPGESGVERLGWRKVHGTVENPEIIEFIVDNPPNERISYIISPRTHQGRGDKNLWTINFYKNGYGTIPGTWMDWAEIEGPIAKPQVENEKPKLTETLFPRPKDWSEKQYAQEVISRFATRAFRGEQPSEEYLEKLFQQFTAVREKGAKVNQALINPLSIILTSPNFLYMVESSGSEGLLTPQELAVRLSYFLWSAPPDEELFVNANDGTLTDPIVLAAQTKRLLEDERSNRFIESFTHQWLDMARLDMFEFKGGLYPKFDNATRESARQEIYETFRHIMDEKLSLHTLLEADFVVINDILADFYDLTDTKSSEFKKIALPKDSPRGGLLGTAAVLAMGSDGIRSSPVERGAWVLRYLLNDPPPPAPANVPQLNRLEDKILSARELQKAHMEEPQCAQCHNKIDPIGYGLENFNAAGEWRAEELVPAGKGILKNKFKKFAIQPAGKLRDGTVFNDYHELKKIIAQRSDGFTQGFTEALIAYGLGRPYGFTDYDLAAKIQSKAQDNSPEISELIHALVQSKQFQTK
ncbi:MAG: DUF1592 domain-containing protein [Akkermansiaceae bacterium]|nr:DUF1592 domain-containing protein [Akkermansiaceae bacterium]